MDLGRKRNKEMSLPSIASEPKDTIEYPSMSIEHKIGDYNYGDTFTATVKFRVKKVSQGKDWSGDDPKHRIELEALSMDIAKPKGKGFPS